MATVTLTALAAATFWYRSNSAVKPAIRAEFGYVPSIKPMLQRRYPGAMFDGKSKSWLVPNETIEEVSAFFAGHDFKVIVDGKSVSIPEKAEE